MERNRNHADNRVTRSQTRARRHLNDDQLEALAVAFGSHLIRNAPPQPSRYGALLSRNMLKINND